MSEVAAWLNGLGLGKYARAFEDHEIDVEALPHLTEDMLEEIGLPVGPRAKVLSAISGLALPSASSLEQTRSARTVEATTRTAEKPRQAERRQMTVMLCDLVDSTQLASGLDPEDFKSVMHAYQQACGAVIERYEGHVAQYRGDGIEVYFGWPVAQEDAAERAVRAGLEIVEAVKAVESPKPLAVRVGISTGIVVIGESGFGDPSKPSGAVGDAPHIAARLQALATPDSVVIAEATRRLISARVDQVALGPQVLKGIAEKIPAFRVLHVREDSSRFQAARASSLTPFVGRRTELALLQQRWRDAKDGEGQVVYLSGVPGIGKSRIVHELGQWIGTEHHFSLRFQCLPHHTSSALFPVIQQIRGLAQLTDGDSDQGKLEKLHKLLSLATEQPDRTVPYIAELVSIPIAPRYAPLALTALQVKVQTLFVLVDLLLGLSARGPVFCLLEDAQWIDPSTQELLDLLVDQAGKARILLVVTHRPEYLPRSGAHGNVSALAIARLGRRDVAEMARLVLRGKTAAPALLKRIVEESDSIPLFVEELARGVIKSSSVSKVGKFDPGAEPSASWSVPDSLRDSLMARLDRAPQGRSVAQMAAVVGREFSYEILLRVSSLSKAELDTTLAHLQQSEIVQRIDSQNSTRFAFKHALLRDAAYESLLKSTRREIHAQVGAAIKSELPEIVADQPELLAYHYNLAGNAELAVRYWVMGGQRARGRSANVEAMEQFRKALESLALLPDTPARSATELAIHLSLGLCSIAVRGYSSDDTRKSFERACSLSAQLGEPQKEIQAIFGLWGHYWMRAQHERAMELAEMLLARAELLSDPVGLVVGHRSLGSTLFSLGDFVRAQAHLERAISLAQQSTGEGLSSTYAVDPRVAAQLLLAWDLWILGYPGQALDNVLQALEQATQRADPYSTAFAHYVTSAVRLLRGEAQNSLEHAERSHALSGEYRINLYALYSRFGRGCALAMMGQSDVAILEIRKGIEEARRSNLGYMRGFMLGWLATVQAATGDADGALSTIDEAMNHINDTAGRAWEAELLRLRGDMLLAARPDAVQDAELSYRDAIAVANRQRARSLELRAATSLARLLRGQGKADEARGLLAPIYGWFTEGLDTADPREAKALLDELS
jgi:class 3 adenylate cyclase/tetratricopeptide (TPR) repeat protein